MSNFYRSKIFGFRKTKLRKEFDKLLMALHNANAREYPAAGRAVYRVRKKFQARYGTAEEFLQLPESEKFAFCNKVYALKEKVFDDKRDGSSGSTLGTFLVLYYILALVYDENQKTINYMAGVLEILNEMGSNTHTNRFAQ
mgnify:CR=1 FL=1